MTDQTLNGVFLSPPAAADAQGQDHAIAAMLYGELDAAFLAEAAAQTRCQEVIKKANAYGYWVNPNQYTDPTGAVRYAVKLTRDVPRT